MIRAPLGDTGLSIPRLVFGCAPMMGLVGRRASLAALGHAFDRGVDYFDVARSYGYGEAESLLGEFIAGRRDRVLIATKAGILPRGEGSLVRRVVKPAARWAFSLVPGLRRGLRQALGSQSSPGQFSPGSVRASLETSLRKLGTDHVDILFLHDCSAETVRDEALLNELRRFVEAGTVRWCGVSTFPDVARRARRASDGLLRVLQFPHGLVDTGAEELLHDPELATTGKLAFQPFGGREGRATLKGRIAGLRADPELDAGLRAKLEGSRDRVLAELCLGSVLGEEGVTAALCSMFTPRHIDVNIDAVVANRFSADEIRLVQRRLANPHGRRIG